MVIISVDSLYDFKEILYMNSWMNERCVQLNVFGAKMLWIRSLVHFSFIIGGIQNQNPTIDTLSLEEVPVSTPEIFSYCYCRFRPYC